MGTAKKWTAKQPDDTKPTKWHASRPDIIEILDEEAKPLHGDALGQPNNLKPAMSTSHHDVLSVLNIKVEPVAQSSEPEIPTWHVNLVSENSPLS